MPDGPRAIAFDLDFESLASLREALPGWDIETVSGATTGSLARDWDPGPADLLVVGARDSVEGALGLCRGLRSQAGRAGTPLLVLVAPAREGLVRAALEAGAHSCLVLPIHAKDLASAAARARAGNQPGRHTRSLERAQCPDPQQDVGGEA